MIKKKKIGKYLTMFSLLFLANPQPVSGEEMKFINAKTGMTIIEFNDSETIVHDPMLKAEFEFNGILIPPMFAEEFGGKHVVYLGDEEFRDAFINVYYPLEVKNKQLFQLVE